MNQEIILEVLGEIRSDISQHMEWRRKLFDHPEHTKFEVTAESVKNTFPSLAQKIQRANLVFIVEKENGSSKDAVVFKFYPASYPEYVKVSFNNPTIRHW